MDSNQTTATASLKQQLLDRMAKMKSDEAKKNEASDTEHFNRVYNDPEAWTTLNRKGGSILPS